MGGLVFGFNDDEFADPTTQLREQGAEVETYTVQPGETVTDQHGNTYTANRQND